MSDRRNPYLILGLHFGASASEAAAAFARLSRRIKKDPGSPYTLEDANWALHQIQQGETDHAEGVTHYRVPADPSLFPRPIELILAPQPLPRTTSDSTGAIAGLREQVLAEVLAHDLDAITKDVDALIYDHGDRNSGR